MRMKDRLLIGTIVAGGIPAGCRPVGLTRAGPDAGGFDRTGHIRRGRRDGRRRRQRQEGRLDHQRSASSPTRRAALLSRPRGSSPATTRSRRARPAMNSTAAKAADVAAGQEAKADIKLKKVENLSAHLTNAEWLMSMPGTDEQKQFLLNCTGCHTLERIMKSTLRRRRVPADLPADERLLSGQHAAEAAAARRHCHARCRPRRQRQEDRGMARQHQPEPAGRPGASRSRPSRGSPANRLT